MPTSVPAIRAQMGTHTYYVGTMRARDLSQQVGVASELEDWTTLTIEELYQRGLNKRRVEQEIAPYLVNTPDRFFGSIIVLVKAPDSIAFESMEELVASLPAGTRAATKDIGVLTLGLGGAAGALVALDGQHRLAALRSVVQGAAERGPHEADVGDDSVTVIFVAHKSDVASRRLFTTLNRSARKVSKNDILLMGEDDARNIVGRALAQDPLVAPRGLLDHPMVKFDGNSIKESDTAITTLGAVNDLVEIVAETMRLPFALADDWSVRPSESELSDLTVEARKWLHALFEVFPDLMSLRDQPAQIPVERAVERNSSMLLKPAGLVVFFKAVQLALDPSKGGLPDLNAAMLAVAGVGWSLGDPHWKGLMLNDRGAITGRRNEWDLAAEVVTCMAADLNINEEFRSRVVTRYGNHIGRPGVSLPLGA